MGNCLRTSSNKVLSNDEDEHGEPQMESAQPFAPKDNLEVKDIKEEEEEEKKKKKKNRVRFAGEIENGQERNRGESKTGVVRVRLVVTHEELRQILEYKKTRESKFTSLEQLLSEMKLKGTSVKEVVDKNDHGSCVNGNYWTPALESIPEDD